MTTPKAGRLLKKWSDNGWLTRMDFDNHLKVLGPELDAAIAQAVQEENEACAAFVELIAPTEYVQRIAAAIRARRAPTPGAGGPDEA